MDKFELLKQYKDLLDNGIITQEEFDAKKKEILETPEGSKVFGSLMKGAKDKANELKGQTEKKIEEATKKQEEYQKRKKAEDEVKQKRKEEKAAAKAQEQRERKIEREQKRTEAAEKRKAFFSNKKNKTIIAVSCVAVIIIIAFFSFIQPNIIKPMMDYNKAVTLFNNGEYTEASRKFSALGDYKDSKKQYENCQVAYADDIVSRSTSVDALYLKTALNIYKKFSNNENVTVDNVNKCKDALYKKGIELYKGKNYAEAIEWFNLLNGYSDSYSYIDKCNAEIKKQNEAKEKAKEKAAKEAAAAKEKAAQEAREEVQKQIEKNTADETAARRESGLIGTWYAKQVINYRDEDMTDQMEDLSTYYFTFNDDGTGICHLGEYDSLGGGDKEFTWKLEDVDGFGDDAVGTWTLNGDTDTIFYYDDHILMYTDKMDSIFYDMRFFCYK